MAFDLSVFRDPSLKEEFIQWLIDNQWPEENKRCTRLWDYYTNPMYDMHRMGQDQEESGRNYIQAQEAGLPPRITGSRADLVSADQPRLQRKEVVIENDIAWRINAMVDFLFGKPVMIQSTAADGARRTEIQMILRAVFDANGGPVFFQDLAVLGSVFGFVDCIVRPGELLSALLHSGAHLKRTSAQARRTITSFDSVLKGAADIVLEPIEAGRALPVLEENECKRIRYYVQHFIQWRNDVTEPERKNISLPGACGSGLTRRSVWVTEIIGPDAWKRYEDGELTAEGINPLGRLPIVHIQNLPQPGYYEGISDVQQLIGLQDELNTRLSDRASRITMQSFKMYLAKGFWSPPDLTIRPGRLWYSDNTEAKIDEFGGDADSPSESLHIAEIREAMDKISGVTPVVAGVLKNKLGNLSSAVALKMTFMGMLSKTYRKQMTYAQGIRQMCGLILDILDKAGVYRTDLSERDVEVVFPHPLEETLDTEQSLVDSSHVDLDC